MNRIRLGISACLLGEKVRYDGQHKLDHFLCDTLGEFVEWHPVCPEVGCGLPVPRESMHLEGTAQAPRLITTRTARDLTEQMQAWIEKTLPDLAAADLRGFVFKSKSPSSGMRDIKIYTAAGMPSNKGAGIFAKAFMERFPLLPVEDEGRLNDPRLRENFIERVFVYHRWREFETADGSLGGLVDFHTRHKLLMMSHSPAALTVLGRIVAGAKRRPPATVRAEYLAQLMPALALQATIRKHTNVLDHIMGYFKRQIGADEKVELVEVIAAYHAGLVPLVVPVTLLRHYVRKYDQAYLRNQAYLDPHPAELMLRNHA
jgi:uncharacterized protein YbgA (DUF1722 family)/uncharacterized protein YbbK (DUF523 family)